MPVQDRRRAIAHHCASVRPEHTPRSLTVLARTGKKQRKDGVVKQQLSAHEKYRKEKLASHDCSCLANLAILRSPELLPGLLVTARKRAV